MEIELKNISGLRGKYNFEMDKGLSILHAPNGTGKSSLLRAIHLVIGNSRLSQDLLNNYLTEREVNGSVKLNYDNVESEVQIQKNKDKVQIIYSNVDNEVFRYPAEDLCFVRANSELYQGVMNNDESQITHWFHMVTQVHKFELFLEISAKLLSEFKVKRDDLRKKVKKDVSNNQDQIEKLKKETREIANEIDLILDSEEYKNFMKDHQEKQNQIKQLRKLRKNLNNKKTKLTNEIFNKESEFEKAKKEITSLNLELNNYDSQLPIKKAKLTRLETERDKLEVSQNKFKKEIAEFQEKLGYERSLLMDYKNLLKRDKCPTCHQNLDQIVIKDLVSKKEVKVKKLEKSVKDRKEKDKSIFNNIQEIEDEITREIEEKNKELLEIQGNLAEENPLQEKIFKLQEKSNSKDRLINKLEDELEESSEYQLEYLKSEKYVQKANDIHQYYSEKVRHLKKETFDQINNSLLNSFKLLELAKLKRIEFGEKDDKYTLEIIRDNNVYTTLEKLSGAEKSLVTLIIQWVVKEMVLPNQPIFLVDEVTTEMDDTRFKDILNYISQKTNYVIVARHKPYDGKKSILIILLLYLTLNKNQFDIISIIIYMTPLNQKCNIYTLLLEENQFIHL
ncbi:MAG: AAA family ATPase [Candidatus Lokiarchaeota archaeon]